MDTIILNPLLKLCTPVLQLCAVFFSNDLAAKLQISYREKLQDALKVFENQALALETSQHEIQLSLYALTAFIDEAILNSSCVFRSQWMNKPLQIQYFGDNLAGEGFYKKLTELRLAGSQSINVLEIYYVCLQLDFKGIYSIKNPDELLALQLELRNQIEALRPTINIVVSKNEASAFTLKTSEGIFARWFRKLCRIPFQNKAEHKPSLAKLSTIAILLIFITYSCFSIIMNYKANKILKAIESSYLKTLHTYNTYHNYSPTSFPQGLYSSSSGKAGIQSTGKLTRNSLYARVRGHDGRAVTTYQK